MIARIVRVGLAVVAYLGGGVFHLVLLIRGDLEPYRLFGEFALIPAYGAAWESLVLPALPWIVLPVVAFEWAAGIMMLAAGRHARIGQVAGACWNLVLAPFGWWGWTNLLLAAVHIWLARYRFDTPAWAGLARAAHLGARWTPRGGVR